MAGQYTRMFQSLMALQESLNLTETGGFNPSVDVFEASGKFVIAVALAGVKPSDVRLNVDRGVLVLSGKRREIMPGKPKEYHQLEITKGQFQKLLPLPSDVVGKHIEANFENGILLIQIQKEKKRSQRTRIIRLKVQ